MGLVGPEGAGSRSESRWRVRKRPIPEIVKGIHGLLFELQ